MQVGRRIISQIVSPLEVLTVADAKLWCKVDSNEDDNTIAALIRAAFKSINTYVGYSILSANVKIEFDGLQGLPSVVNPLTGTYYAQGNYLQLATYLTSVDALSYVTTSEALATMPSTGWKNPTALKLPSMGCKIVVTDVPSDLTENELKYVVSAKEGYELGSVPDDIITAAKMLVSGWYDNRASMVYGTMNDMPFSVNYLLDPYRSMQLL